jgi:outer membrane protein
MSTSVRSSLALFALLAAAASQTASAQSYTFKLGGGYIVPNATSTDFSGQLPNGATAAPGVQLEVQAKSTLIFSIERAINDHFGIELVLGVPPKHDVTLKVSDTVKAGAARAATVFGAAGGTGSGTVVPFLMSPSGGGLSQPVAIATYTQLALASHIAQYSDATVSKVTQIAPTLFLNYKFGEPSQALRPYLGVGINYTRLTTDLTSTGEAYYSGVPMKLTLSPSWGPAAQAGLSYKIDKNWSVNAGVSTAFVSTTLRVTGNGYSHSTKFDFTPTVYTATVGYTF